MGLVCGYCPFHILSDNTDDALTLDSFHYFSHLSHRTCKVVFLKELGFFFNITEYIDLNDEQDNDNEESDDTGRYYQGQEEW